MNGPTPPPVGAHFLDTSAVIALMRRGRKAAAEALLPFATVAELSIGGFRSREPAREWRRIELTLAEVAGIVYPTARTLWLYAEWSARMQAAGTPLPVNDLWIAALALEWDLPLATTDGHFARIAGLRCMAA